VTDVPMFDIPRPCARCGRPDSVVDASHDVCDYCLHLDHRPGNRVATGAGTDCHWCAVSVTPSQAATNGGNASLQAANREWVWAVKTVLNRYRHSGEPFTSAHVLGEVRALGIETKDARALGPIITSQASAGLIRPTGNFVPSPLREHHGAPKREWVAA
jgi:hypothetical protein